MSASLKVPWGICNVSFSIWGRMLLIASSQLTYDDNKIWANINSQCTIEKAQGAPYLKFITGTRRYSSPNSTGHINSSLMPLLCQKHKSRNRENLLKRKQHNLLHLDCWQIVGKDYAEYGHPRTILTSGYHSCSPKGYWIFQCQKVLFQSA